MTSLKELWNSEINEIQNEIEKPIPDFKLKHKTSHTEYDFVNQIRIDAMYKEFLNTAQPSIPLTSNTFKLNDMIDKNSQISNSIVDTLKDIRLLCVKYSKLQSNLKDHQKEIEDAIIDEQNQLRESRKKLADAKVHVSAEEARHDLMTNKDSPFLFRKWLKQIQESGPEYIRNSQPDDPYPHQTEERVGDYVGKHVIQLLGCCCGNNAWYRIHPKYEWNYDSGQWNIKALKGPCSYWSGHIGYCWEGTMSRENLNYAC
jgi:hypothetical protein